jgi:hypothetical protein
VFNGLSVTQESWALRGPPSWIACWPIEGPRWRGLRPTEVCLFPNGKRSESWRTRGGYVGRPFSPPCY